MFPGNRERHKISPISTPCYISYPSSTSLTTQKNCIFLYQLITFARHCTHSTHHSYHTPNYRGDDKSLARSGRKQARKHVGDARDFNNIETRADIKFLFLQGKAPKEIHDILTETLNCFLPCRAKELSMKKSNDTSWDRTSDLPIFGTAP